jgi:hypothetical protein
MRTSRQPSPLQKKIDAKTTGKYVKCEVFG